MTFEEWTAFQTGLLLTLVFVVIVILYFKLRERVSNVEKLLKRFKREVAGESDEESEPEDKPKEI